MVAPFRCDEKVTIEHDIGATKDGYGKRQPQWVPFLEKYWANVQDILPSRAETTKNGIETSAIATRLRLQGAAAVTTKMRVVLHGRGDRVMQIISGPALLDDRRHYEFKLEGFQ